MATSTRIEPIAVEVTVHAAAVTFVFLLIVSHAAAVISTQSVS